MAFTRRLRHAIKILNEEFELLGLKKHPQKTSVGRVENGFEFLGYHYGRDGLRLAEKTIDKFVSKALRLYEQGPVQTRLEWLGGYTKRWVRWTTSGLQSLEIKIQWCHVQCCSPHQTRKNYMKNNELSGLKCIPLSQKVRAKFTYSKPSLHNIIKDHTNCTFTGSGDVTCDNGMSAGTCNDGVGGG